MSKERVNYGVWAYNIHSSWHTHGYLMYCGSDWEAALREYRRIRDKCQFDAVTINRDTFQDITDDVASDEGDTESLFNQPYLSPAVWTKHAEAKRREAPQ